MTPRPAHRVRARDVDVMGIFVAHRQPWLRCIAAEAALTVVAVSTREIWCGVPTLTASAQAMAASLETTT